VVKHSVLVVVSGSRSSSLSAGWFRRLCLALPVLLLVALAAACGGGGGGDDGEGGTPEDDAEPDDGDDTDAPDDGDDADDGEDDGDGFDQVPLIEGLTTLCGAGIIGNQDGDRDTALFNNPVNLVISDGDLIVADFDNNLIRRVTPEGDVTTISQMPEAAMFVRPFGLALAGDTVFIQTDGNSLGQPGPPGGALWRMPVEGGVPDLVRDNVGRARGLLLLSDGRLVLTDRQAHVVQVYDPESGVLAPLAGQLNTAGFAEGQGAAAQFNEPYDLVLLSDGTLLVADLGNHRLRRIDLEGNVSTFAGNGTAGSDDGPLETATFNGPKGLTQAEDGTLYVTDTGSFLVRRISPEGEVTTIAGNGEPGWADDEDPLAGQLYGIEGLDLGHDGYLYIADGTVGEEGLPYHRIRRLTLAE
jgi:sugar lactone lactonase YvrE